MVYLQVLCKFQGVYLFDHAFLLAILFSYQLPMQLQGGLTTHKVHMKEWKNTTTPEKS